MPPPRRCDNNPTMILNEWNVFPCTAGGWHHVLLPSGLPPKVSRALQWFNSKCTWSPNEGSSPSCFKQAASLQICLSIMGSVSAVLYIYIFCTSTSKLNISFCLFCDRQSGQMHKQEHLDSCYSGSRDRLLGFLHPLEAVENSTICAGNSKRNKWYDYICIPILFLNLLKGLTFACITLMLVMAKQLKRHLHSLLK